MKSPCVNLRLEPAPTLARLSAPKDKATRLQNYLLLSQEFVGAGKLAYLKAYASNSPLLPNLILLALLGLCSWYMGSTWTAAATTGVVFFLVSLLRAINRQEYAPSFMSLFASEKQAKRILTEARINLRKLSNEEGSYALRAGLTNLRAHATGDGKKQLPPLPSGFTFGQQHYLPDDADEAFYIIMWSALSMMAHWADVLSPFDETPTEEMPPLPALVQDYVVRFMPDIVGSHPLRFDNDHLDAAYPGLASVVLALTSMGYTMETVTLHVQAWLGMRGREQTSTLTLLPTDLS